MRVIVGLDAPDAGTALVGGRPYQSLRRPLTHVGALLDAAALQPGRSARNHLLWLGHSQGVTASRVDKVVAQSGLQGASGGRRAATHSACGSGWASPRPAGRPAGADAGRAVQRHGSRGDRVDARVPARRWPGGPGGAGLQPPDERAAGHRGSPGRGRPRAGRGERQRAELLGGRVRRPGGGAHRQARPGMERTRRGGRAGDRPARHARSSAALAAEQVVVGCSARHAVPFSEVSAHRASLEEAYLELTRTRSSTAAPSTGRR